MHCSYSRSTCRPTADLLLVWTLHVAEETWQTSSRACAFNKKSKATFVRSFFMNASSSRYESMHRLSGRKYPSRTVPPMLELMGLGAVCPSLRRFYSSSYRKRIGGSESICSVGGAEVCCGVCPLQHHTELLMLFCHQYLAVAIQYPHSQVS